MLRIRKDKKIEILENFGFKLDPTGTCYLRKISDEMEKWPSDERGNGRSCLWILHYPDCKTLLPIYGQDNREMVQPGYSWCSDSRRRQ